MHVYKVEEITSADTPLSNDYRVFLRRRNSNLFFWRYDDLVTEIRVRPSLGYYTYKVSDEDVEQPFRKLVIDAIRSFKEKKKRDGMFANWAPVGKLPQAKVRTS